MNDLSQTKGELFLQCNDQRNEIKQKQGKIPLTSHSTHLCGQTSNKCKPIQVSEILDLAWCQLTDVSISL